LRCTVRYGITQIHDFIILKSPFPRIIPFGQSDQNIYLRWCLGCRGRSALKKNPPNFDPVHSFAA